MKLKTSLSTRAVTALAGVAILVGACAPAVTQAPATAVPATAVPATSAPTAAPATDVPATAAPTAAAMIPIKLQLQWVVQSQFAGYFAAVDQGFYKDEGL